MRYLRAYSAIKMLFNHFNQVSVPYSYTGATARVSRSGDTLYIYSFDLRVLLATHDVTWSRRPLVLSLRRSKLVSGDNHQM